MMAAKCFLLLHGQVHKIFEDEDPKTALENVIDLNLRGSYPMEDVYKVSLIDKYIYLQ